MTWLRSLCRKFAILPTTVSHPASALDGERVVHLDAYRVPQEGRAGASEKRDVLRRLASIRRIVVGEIWMPPTDLRHRARQRAYVVIIALFIADCGCWIGM